MAIRFSLRTGRAPILLATLAIIVAGISYVFLEPDKADEQAGVAMPDSDLVLLGRDIYASQCAACHGANLEGQPNWRARKANGRMPAPPHDETGHTWHHDDATLFNLTKFGLSALIGSPVETDMPAYDSVLSDEQIRAVLAYIKSEWPEEIRQRQSDITNRAATKAGS